MKITTKLDTGEMHTHSIWDEIPEELIRSREKDEMRVELLNGSIIQILGVENGLDALVGIGSKFIVLSEATLLPVSVWIYLLPIAVMDKEASMIFQGTIRPDSWLLDVIDNPPDPLEVIRDLAQIGARQMEEFNMTQDEYLKLKLNQRDGITQEEEKEYSDYYQDHTFLDFTSYTVTDTGLINPVELELTRKSYIAADGNDVRFRQEFFNDRTAVSSGIYGSHMELAINEGRLADWKYNPNYKVNCSLDLGIDDYTVITVWQRVGARLYILDMYKSRDRVNEHYTNWINNYKINISKVFLPHDSHQRNKETGRTTLEYFRNRMPDKMVQYVPKTESLETDIQKVRGYFPNIYFNTSSVEVKALTKELMTYDYIREKTHDGSVGKKTGKPKHSDTVDSFRYSALNAFEDLSIVRNQLS
jgi:hypothetical protein